MTPTPSAWTRLRAAADPFTRRTLNLYSAYTIDRAEYIDTVHLPLGVHDLRDYLTAAGYTPQRLSAAKRHPEHGGLHLLSMRRVPEEHPPGTVREAEGGDYITKIGFDYDPRECQHHVHAFASPVAGQLDVFSHYELRPFCHPVEHYRPEYGETYLQGLADPALELG